MRKIWTFEHEPKNISEMILSDEMKNTLTRIIEEKPNIILSGPPGCGKGTFMNIFMKETGLLSTRDFIKINASDCNSIDDVRNTIRPFSTSMSIGDHKLVYLNECLEENEEIQIGTLDNIKICKLKDLPKDKLFDVISMNQKTGQLENDTADINVIREEECFEIELEDGRKIIATTNHPFFMKNGDHISTKLLKELQINDFVLTA